MWLVSHTFVISQLRIVEWKGPILLDQNQASLKIRSQIKNILRTGQTQQEIKIGDMSELDLT